MHEMKSHEDVAFCSLLGCNVNNELYTERQAMRSDVNLRLMRSHLRITMHAKIYHPPVLDSSPLLFFVYLWLEHGIKPAVPSQHAYLLAQWCVVVLYELE